MPIDVLTAMAHGTLVVTATRRLARRLRLDFANRARTRGQWVWNTPDVVPWAQWLDRLWTEIAETPSQGERLSALNPVQETALWEQVVRGATREHPLLVTADAAASARAAWQLLNEWQVPLQRLEGFNSAETQAFRKWLDEYVDRCREGRWIDAPRLADRCTAAVGSLAGQLARGVCFAGFDELTPQQAAFVRALSEAGCPVTRWMPCIEGSNRSRCDLPREEDEIAAAAAWARRAFERDPAVTVGIVVPELERLRSRAQRIFDDVLTPGAVLPNAARSHAAYNLSLGSRLIDYPPVLTALYILQLAGGPVACEELSYLLRSPFLGGALAEAAQRHLLDADVRRGGELSWTLSRLTAILEGGSTRGCPGLQTCLRALSAAVVGLPARAMPSGWSRLYQQFLYAAGWPGSRPLDSGEYQTVQQWHGALVQLSCLDGITGSQTFPDALALLKRIVADTIFQPEGEDLPLVVLGALEAAGLTFDHLWITGLHDRAWPPPPRPNPLLPSEIQRRHGLPHGSAEREREFAGRMLHRLLCSAQDVIVSWPSQQGDEHLRPSALIRDFRPAEAAATAAPGFYRETIFAARELEVLDDDAGPTLGDDALSGGTGVLKEQAACPFRAFALFRLGSEPLHRPALGIDPLTHGRLVHQVLERLWRDLGTQRQLMALTGDELGSLLERIIRGAMRRLPVRRGAAWRTLLRMEAARLIELLGKLLEKEKQRAPFSVHACEETRVARIGGLCLNTRIDRIDLLEGGGRAVIDYKTGRANVNGWFGKRPDEPQLPLYAVTEPDLLEGVLYAAITAESVEFKGIALRENQFPGVPGYDGSRYHKRHGDWETLLAAWKVQLESIAGQFAAGEARVDPKRPETCTQCHLQAFCRIDEIHGSPEVWA